MSRASSPSPRALAQPSANAFADRRESPRLYYAAEITFSSGNNFYAGRARDISAGGLFFETTEALEVGTRIRIRLQILDKPFAVSAKVCWLLYDRVGRTRGAGVRFVHIPKPMKDAIGEFMRRRAPIQFEFEPSGMLPNSEPP